MAYTSKSESSGAYQQTKKQFDKNDTDWIKVFIELAPAGYDVYKGYSDWKLSQLVNPEYKGMDGLIKFISNPAEAGANVARAKKMIINDSVDTNIMPNKTVEAIEPPPELKVPDNIENEITPVVSKDFSISDRIKSLFPDKSLVSPEKKAQPVKNVMEKVSGLFKRETDPMEFIFRKNKGKDMKNAFDMSKSSKYGRWLKENRPQDYNRIATQLTNPNSLEGQVMKKYIETMNKMAPGDKVNLKTFDIIKGEGNTVKEAAKEIGKKAGEEALKESGKKAGEEALKETGKKVGEEIGKEGAKEAGKAISPGIDAAFATQTLMDKDANVGQKVGSGIDLVGTGMLATPAAPIAPFVKLGGKAINLASSLFPKNQTRQIQTRNLALEADRKKKLNDLLRRNRV